MSRAVLWGSVKWGMRSMAGLLFRRLAYLGLVLTACFVSDAFAATSLEELLSPAPKQCHSTNDESSSVSCPNACRTITLICNVRECGGSYCVIREPNDSGRCYLGVPRSSRIGQYCGRTFESVDALRTYIDWFRSSLAGEVEAILRDPTLSDREKAQRIFSLLLERCAYHDEFLHIVDQFACRSHMSCEERNSGDAFVGCFSNELSTGLIQRVVAALPSASNAFLNSYCSRLASHTAVATYDSCICDTTGIPSARDRTIASS